MIVFAPQRTRTVNKTEQGSANTSKDGSQFSDVLSSTVKDVKDDQQVQAKDAKQLESKKTECKDEKQVDKQGNSSDTDQKDGSESSTSNSPVSSQLVAVVNAQLPQTVSQTVQKIDVDTSDIAIADAVADAQNTGGVSSQATTQTPVLQADAAADEQSALQWLDEAVQAAADGANAVSGKEATEQPAVEKTASQATNTVKVQPDLLGSATKNAQTVQVGSDVKVAEVDTTSVSANADQNAKTVDTSTKSLNANQAASNNLASSDASSQTRIEVTASAEPSREFTIKPQVISPVGGLAESSSTLSSDAVSQVTSTDKSSVNADTSGSQNNQAALFTGQTMSDATVKQTAQAQPATRTDQPLHTQIIDQVVQNVKLIKLPQQNDIVVKLTPPELGTLRVQISQAEQGMTTQIQTSGEQVKGLLQAHLPALNQAFSDAGLKMDSVSVTSGTSFGSLMQDSANGSAQQQQGGQRHHYAGSQDANGNQTATNMSTVATSGETTTYSWLA